MTSYEAKRKLSRAALDCITYQITDLVSSHGAGYGNSHEGAAGGRRACQKSLSDAVSSDISGKILKIPQAEELSGIRAAYMAGISAGLYSEEELFSGWGGAFLLLPWT